MYRFGLTSEAGNCKRQCSLILHNLQLLNMWRVVFFLRHFRIFSAGWQFKLKRSIWSSGPVWYCVKTCREAGSWWKIRAGGRTHVAQPISSELCNVRDEQQVCAVKDVCNTSAERAISPSCVGSRWVMSSPLCCHIPRASSWQHLSTLVRWIHIR